jgi:sugar phosphate isomerase/epimerase
MIALRKTRREFLRQSMYLGAAVAAGPFSKVLVLAAEQPKMRLGLVTYQWGKDWDLDTLIANCAKSKVLGVELRTQHAHKVESNLNSAQRQEVKKKFADSPVTLVGLGTNFEFHNPDPNKLKAQIEGAKAYVVLSRDVGSTGVKVKPNDLPKEVPQEKTIEQIGKSLNELGRYAADYGQEIRLEVHGGCSQLPVIKKIMDYVDRPNVGVCWNCNAEDLAGKGLEYNFNLVKDRFGKTVHVRELNVGDYPYQELINLLAGMNYQGWVLLEGRADPADKVKALTEQQIVWEQMLDKAQKGRPARAGGSGVKITEQDKTLKIEVNGQLFTEYCYKDVPRPYFYPVIGPTGKPIIRHWPMKEVEGEARDHVHHRSLWFTHGDVNGIDFWAEGGGKKGTIVHEEFLEVTSGSQVGVIKSRNKWVGPDGKIVCTDTRTHKIYNPTLADYGMMDFEITINASNGEVVFGDTKEGSMAIRLGPTIQVDGPTGKGHIVNSEGLRDADTWGKRATWCDCYGPVDGDVVGVAIFDHPSNPRHPTWWHVRTYGLFAANPFGVHDFEKKPAGTGNLTIPAGQSVTFKYRFYLHKGDEKQGKVAECYSEYVTGK